MSQPVQRFEMWPIKVAVFQDDYGYKISAQKSYKDKTSGEWKNTTSMSAAETLACAHLLTEAACWVMRQPPIQNQGGSGESKPKGESKPRGDAKPKAEGSDNPPAVEDDEVPF